MYSTTPDCSECYNPLTREQYSVNDATLMINPFLGKYKQCWEIECKVVFYWDGHIWYITVQRPELKRLKYFLQHHTTKWEWEGQKHDTCCINSLHSLRWKLLSNTIQLLVIQILQHWESQTKQKPMYDFIVYLCNSIKLE